MAFPNDNTATHDFGDTMPRRDVSWMIGLGVAAAIGVPGLGLYFAARALDINATVVGVRTGAEIPPSNTMFEKHLIRSGVEHS